MSNGQLEKQWLKKYYICRDSDDLMITLFSHVWILEPESSESLNHSWVELVSLAWGEIHLLGSFMISCRVT